MSKKIKSAGGAAPQRQRYDEAFKLDAVRLRQQSGRPRVQVARDLGVSDVSLALWETRYGAEGAAGSPRGAAARTTAGPLSAVAALGEVARLKAELEHMTKRRDILKKARAIVSQDPKNGLK